MKKLYSIVIHPHDEIIQLFKNLKYQLKSKTGKYLSCDSTAHITVIEFEATDEQLRKIVLKLIRIANEEKSFDAFFDQMICSEKSLSVFALPNKSSNEDFKKLLNKIRKDINIEGRGKNAAHISIGRKLSPEQLDISQGLFSNVKFDFLCDRIALRKFNTDKKQFEVMKIFPLSGALSTEKQMTLDFEN